VKNVREISIDYIQKNFRLFSIGSRNLIKTRKRHVVQAQLAMFFAKKFTKASLANIVTN
jgi:chromosomal replication initiator protein